MIDLLLENLDLRGNWTTLGLLRYYVTHCVFIVLINQLYVNVIMIVHDLNNSLVLINQPKFRAPPAPAPARGPGGGG